MREKPSIQDALPSRGNKIIQQKMKMIKEKKRKNIELSNSQKSRPPHVFIAHNQIVFMQYPHPAIFLLLSPVPPGDHVAGGDRSDRGERHVGTVRRLGNAGTGPMRHLFSFQDSCLRWRGALRWAERCAERKGRSAATCSAVCWTEMGTRGICRRC